MSKHCVECFASASAILAMTSRSRFRLASCQASGGPQHIFHVYANINVKSTFDVLTIYLSLSIYHYLSIYIYLSIYLSYVFVFPLCIYIRIYCIIVPLYYSPIILPLFPHYYDIPLSSNYVPIVLRLFSQYPMSHYSPTTIQLSTINFFSHFYATILLLLSNYSHIIIPLC